MREMRIYRAHSYSSVEIVQEEEKKVPAFIFNIIKPYFLIILPKNIEPSFIGLRVGYTKAKEKEKAGWCCQSFGFPRFLFSPPHIYIRESYEKWAFIHEVGHALNERLGSPSKRFFRPEKAITNYGEINHREYFAEAFREYFEPIEKEKLFKADKNIFYFIRATIKGAAGKN